MVDDAGTHPVHLDAMVRQVIAELRDRDRADSPDPASVADLLETVADRLRAAEIGSVELFASCVAVIPGARTPRHLRSVRITADPEFAQHHAAQTGGEVLPLIDLDDIRRRNGREPVAAAGRA